MPGDRVILKGVFRETLTIPNSGGNSYTIGTVSVTNGSATVTGSGTTFTGNVFVNGVFQSHVLASGTDGVTNGTATFTSAAGNFQAGHIGMTIRIGTKGAYIISAVASATSITLKNPDASAPSPSAGSSLTYNVGPESPYDILSVDSNTQITLAKPWSGPTLTGIAYECWRPIFIIGDVSGALTDGVGGIVRVTGSDNDTSIARSTIITTTSKNYITIRDLALDSSTGTSINLTTCTNTIVEDCSLSGQTGTGNVYNVAGATQAHNTIRRCRFFNIAPSSNVILHQHSSTVSDCGGLVENCIIQGSSAAFLIDSTRVGGVLVRNNIVVGGGRGITVDTALATGQAITANNNIVVGCATGMQGTTTGEVVEDFNRIMQGTARSSVTSGANSDTSLVLLDSSILLAGFRFPWQFGVLSQWSTLIAKAGMNPPADDFFGLLRRPGNGSWGPIEFNPVVRATGTKDAGSASLSLPVAGRHQIIVNVTNASTVISIKVYREANYAGSNPGFIIKQAGVADIVVTDAGSASTFNTITTTFTPAATSSYVIVELFSLNTATSSSFAVYFDTMLVTTALTTGGFEQWITDRIPLANYAGAAGSSSTIVSGTPFKGPFG